jgi:hypothetical protein
VNREQRVGIIDTLSHGYGLVLRQPWLALVPVLVDCWLWLGPRLPAEALVAPLLASDAAQGENGQLLETTLIGLRLAGPQSDLFTLLARQLPSLLRVVAPEQTPLAIARPLLTPSEPWALLLLASLLLLGGLLLMMLYTTLIGLVILGQSASLGQLLRRAGRGWLRLLALSGLVLLGLLALAIPLGLLASAAALVGYSAVFFLVQLLFIGLVLWLNIYLFFVVDAIVISDAGPLQAIRLSIRVVRANLWATLGLIILLNIIQLGLTGIVFVALAGTPIGLPLAIGANAFISTGLVTATMLFYRDRLARQPASAPAPAG